MDRRNRIALTVTTVLAVTGSALGQNALGDGQALDRNLQVGSGGRNTRVRDLDASIRFNNAVITGNASGGRSFHGNVGYRASDEFGGRLGSNELYTFRRDSVQSAFAGTGVRGSDAIQYQFAVSTGQALPSALAGGVGIVPRAFASSQAQVRSSASSSLRSTADFLTSQAVRPTLVGYRADENGVYTATASPLLGVTWYPLEQTDSAPRDPSATPSRPGDGTPPLRPRAKPMGLSGLEATATGLPSPLELAGMGRQAREDSPSKANNLAVTAVQPKVRSESYTRVLDAFRESYAERDAGGSRAASADPLEIDDPAAPWRRDLDRLRDSLRPGDDRSERDQRTPGAADKPLKPAPGPSPRPETPMAIPGLDPEGLIAPPEKTGLQDEDFVTKRMIEILRDANVRIDSLRPASPSADQASYAAHMHEGQQALAEGRFFDAEDRFSRAMSAMPADPISGVGRVHAQLGAGLYLSAANNLRALIKEHPELAAARFNITLVPGDARAVKIAEQLRIEIGRAGDRLARDSGFLLAYLGRLRGDGPMLEEGLSAWKQRIAADDASERSLHRLLSRVWQ